VQCVLDEVEALAPNGSNLIMLALCQPILPESVRLPNGREHFVANIHTVRPCASLCTSSYAIRRRAAATFFDTVRRAHVRRKRGGEGLEAKYMPFHRFGLDANIRGYYYRTRSLVPEREWPRCVDYPTYTCLQSSSNPECMGGLFTQNASLLSQAEHAGHAW